MTATPVLQERGKRSLSWEGKDLGCMSISGAVPWGVGMISIPLMQPEPFLGDLLGGHGFF